MNILTLYRIYYIFANSIFLDNYSNALKTYDPDNNFKFVVLPRNETDYQIHTKNINGTFDLLVPIIPYLKAKKLIGKDLVFVHNNQFIAITKSQKSAQKLAFASLKEHYTWQNKLLR